MEVERRRHVEPINDSCSCKSTTAYTQLHTRVCVLVCVYHQWYTADLFPLLLTFIQLVTCWNHCSVLRSDTIWKMHRSVSENVPHFHTGGTQWKRQSSLYQSYFKILMTGLFIMHKVQRKGKKSFFFFFLLLPSGVGVSWLCGAARNYANHIWVKVNHLVLWNYNQLLLIHEGKWATCGKVESLLTLTLFVCWRRRRRAGLPRIPLLVLISLKLDSLFPV